MPKYTVTQDCRNVRKWEIEADNPAHAMALLEDGSDLAEIVEDYCTDVTDESLTLDGVSCDDEADFRHDVTSFPVEGRPGKWGALDNEGGEIPGEFDNQADAINAAVKASRWED
jgi:hypothetical protein